MTSMVRVERKGNDVRLRVRGGSKVGRARGVRRRRHARGEAGFAAGGCAVAVAVPRPIDEPEYVEVVDADERLDAEAEIDWILGGARQRNAMTGEDI